MERLDSIQVDSLKIRIPIEKVETIKELKIHWVGLNEETGEINPKKFKQEAYSIEESGIKTKFAIEKQRLKFNETESETFLIILLNSKLLKEKYFEGITIDNIKEVYDKLMSYEIVSFSFDTFLLAECTDVDFKRDTFSKHFKEIIKGLFQIAKESKEKDRGAKLFNKFDNQGIEFSDRETTKFFNNPFLKIYHKEIELKNKSKDFYGAYLHDGVSEKLIKDRVRVEFTIKNKKHFRQFKVNDTTLKNILSLTHENKLEMLRSILNSHIRTERVKITMHRSDLSPTEIIFLGFIEIALQNNLPFSYAIEEVLRGISDKSKRSKKRSELKHLYDTYLKGKNYDIKAESFGKFLDWLTVA